MRGSLWRVGGPFYILAGDSSQGEEPLGSKRNRDSRRKFGASLLGWADSHDVTLANCLTEDIQDGFPLRDDAFDAVVGLFTMLQVCLGQREPGEPSER
jgi:hypothetical protein